MDERLTKALDASKLRHTHNIEKRRLQEKLKVQLTVPFGGGRFAVTPDLISFVHYLTTTEQWDHVLLDDNSTPILVKNIGEFQKLLTSTYQEATGQYYQDFETLRKKRSIKDIVNL